jgi:hypothetical protein
MSAEVWMLVATAVLAVVAIGAALIAVRAVRQVSRTPAAEAVEPAPPEPVHRPIAVVIHEAPDDDRDELGVLEPRVVEGRLVVPPTQQQVMQTAMGRPGVRLSCWATASRR